MKTEEQKLSTESQDTDQHVLTRDIAVTEWMRYGFDDLMVEFFPLEKWHYYQPFFLAQAIEKIIKAYLIGKRAGEYETLGFQKAKLKIDEIARSHSHNIRNLINAITGSIPEVLDLLGKNYDSFSGGDFVKVLSSGYEECRYPVPRSICESYPIKGADDAYWDPLASSGLEKFAFDLIAIVFRKIKNDYGLEISKNNWYEPYRNRISENDWNRFCNLFFEKVFSLETLKEKTQ
ncbi:MAG: hypothetical protein A3C47_05610 [Omnitrophica bacterium RIFCSPHIGHO2_02_FULL_51_18]|nr:MAG: hypothetical protein A3C47_05610 [Omnitrophica bacterium RIFCSPHIGHO2_02_FULL_51_18]